MVKDGVCKACGASGDVIRVSTKGKQGTRWLCRPCIRENNRWNNYGLTPERYEEMQKQQEGKCAICGKDGSLCKRPGPGGYYGLVIDHCHKTGKVRALLCHHCNRILASAEESIQLLLNAVDYLKTHNGVDE